MLTHSIHERTPEVCLTKKQEKAVGSRRLSARLFADRVDSFPLSYESGGRNPTIVLGERCHCSL